MKYIVIFWILTIFYACSKERFAEVLIVDPQNKTHKKESIFKYIWDIEEKKKIIFNNQQIDVPAGIHLYIVPHNSKTFELSCERKIKEGIKWKAYLGYTAELPHRFIDTFGATYPLYLGSDISDYSIAMQGANVYKINYICKVLSW